MRIRSALLALAALAVPGFAGAQTVTSLTNATIDRGTLGTADCGRTYRFSVEARNGAGAATGLANSDNWTLSVSRNSNCSNGGTVNRPFTAVANQNGVYEATLTGTQIVQAGLSAACNNLRQDATLYVCAGWENDGDVDDPTPRGARVEVMTAGVEQPRLTGVESGDRRLYLRFEPADSSPDRWQVCYQEVTGTNASGLEGEETEPFGEPGPGGDPGTGGDVGVGGAGGDVGVGGAGGDEGIGGAGGDEGVGGAGGDGGMGGEGGEGGMGGAGGTGGTGGTIAFDPCEGGRVTGSFSGRRRNYTLEGLRNGSTYAVAVRAIDTAGNRSDPSNVMQGTPRNVNNFWDLYKDAGGQEDGGCSSAAGPAALGLLLSGLFLARRRSGRR